MNTQIAPRIVSNSLRTFNSVVAILLMTICIMSEAKAQGSTDGTTPLGLTPGSPTGSYALSDFDVVNLYNGSLNFRLPIYQIAGRGGAGFAITLQVQKKWTVHRHFEPGVGYFYYADGSWWSENGVGWILDAGKVDIRTGYREQPTGFPVEGLTRITFTAPDGTEYEFRDQVTEPRPYANFPVAPNIYFSGVGALLEFTVRDQNLITMTDITVKEEVTPADTVQNTDLVLRPDGKIVDLIGRGHFGPQLTNAEVRAVAARERNTPNTVPQSHVMTIMSSRGILAVATHERTLTNVDGNGNLLPITTVNVNGGSYPNNYTISHTRVQVRPMPIYRCPRVF